MPLNVTVAEQEGLKRKLQVEVPLDEVRTTYDEVFQRLRTGLRVDGFRPGKYPRHLAEKRFRSVMAGEAMQTLVPKYFEEALSELSLRPATQPRFENLDIDKQRPFRFDVEFEVVPNIELLPLSEYSLAVREANVTEADVEARVDEVRRRRASLEEKTDAPAEAHDVVRFDFHGTLDGEEFEGGSGEDQQLELGAGGYLPDFEAQFQGIRAGERKEFDVTFPGDYGQASLAGKTVHFEVTAKQVQQPVPPALDEAFVKQFGEFETVEAFRAKVKEDLEAERTREIMQGYQNQLADRMRERYDFAVPEALVHQSLHDFEHRLEHDEPDVLKDAEGLEQRKADERGKIEANLRVAYVVDALAKQYGIEPEAEEVRQRFNMQSYMLRQNPTDLMQTPFGQRLLMQIRESMLTERTLQKLAEDVLAAGGGTADTGATEPASRKAGAQAAKGAAKAAAEKSSKDKEKAGGKPKSGKAKAKA